MASSALSLQSIHNQHIMAGERVCLIGSGPSGMAFLYHLEKLRQEGKTVPEVVCYEKAADWGGLWNYDWRTGIHSYKSVT